MARSTTRKEPKPFTMVLRSQRSHVKRYNLRSQTLHPLPIANKRAVKRVPPVQRAPIRAHVRTSYKTRYEELKCVIDPFLTCHACERKVSQPLIPICGHAICAGCVRKNRVQALKDDFLARCGSSCNKLWLEAPAPGLLLEALVNCLEEEEVCSNERPPRLTDELIWPLCR
ncbi:hypothetical protein F5890DRAFT_1655535 [Lentinula detonsa]|uniref:RING-type domain-containing protein n=1 Tax=Lentinula detonsa TaxID=2804962 RepID=A0AA38ULQ4_9AGAR|nr:hypothetical protein F5890DRAFT_1655535 [Lentinula detonsa]